MDSFFVVQTNTGKAFRVVRRGHQMVVESKRPSGQWDVQWKIDIIEEDDAEARALLAACRTALRFGDDLATMGQCARMIEKAEPEAQPKHPILEAARSQLGLITLLPRDEKLCARVPRDLKDELVEETRKLCLASSMKLTLSDYLIYRLSRHHTPD